MSEPLESTPISKEEFVKAVSGWPCAASYWGECNKPATMWADGDSWCDDCAKRFGKKAISRADFYRDFAGVEIDPPNNT